MDTLGAELLGGSPAQSLVAPPSTTDDHDVYLSAITDFPVGSESGTRSDHDIYLFAPGAVTYTPLSYTRSASVSVGLPVETAVRITAVGRSVSDSNPVTADAASRTRIAPRTASEILPAMTDTAVGRQLFMRTVSETLPVLTDVATRIKILSRTASDAVDIPVASATSQYAFGRTVSEIYGIPLAVSIRGFDGARATSDSLSSQTVTASGVRLITRIASDTLLSFQDTASFFISHYPSSPGAPENDNAKWALPLQPGTTSRAWSNLNASTETGETYTMASVWYSWYCATDGTQVIQTSSSFDTYLMLYRPNVPSPQGISDLTFLLSDDDSGGGSQAKLTFTGARGTTYWIAVGGFSNGRGSGTLLYPDPAPTTLTHQLSGRSDGVAHAGGIEGKLATTPTASLITGLAAGKASAFAHQPSPTHTLGTATRIQSRFGITRQATVVPLVPQRAAGSSAALGDLSVRSYLMVPNLIKGGSSVSGRMDSVIFMSGAVTGSSSVKALIGEIRVLSGSILGSATVSATLTRHRLRSTGSLGAATVRGQLAVRIPTLGGIVRGTSTVSADMRVQDPQPFQGTAVGGTRVQGRLGLIGPMVGTPIQGGSTVSGTVIRHTFVPSSIVGGSSVTGDTTHRRVFSMLGYVTAEGERSDGVDGYVAKSTTDQVAQPPGVRPDLEPIKRQPVLFT